VERGAGDIVRSVASSYRTSTGLAHGKCMFNVHLELKSSIECKRGSMQRCFTAVADDNRRGRFFRVVGAVDRKAALSGAVVLGQFNCEGDDSLAKSGVLDANESSMETQSLIRQHQTRRVLR
jgi:hypothetical protein